jgi:hypothetical protein
MGECNHSQDEIQAAHKRAAEAVVSTSTADREALNRRASEVIQDAREAWPSISDKDLAGFFRSQALLAAGLSELSVMKLGTVLDILFGNCTIAAAALSGAYDLDNAEEPKHDLNELVEEAATVHSHNDDENPPLIGMYL